MLVPHSIIDAECNLWRSGVSYAKWLLEGLDYKELNITCLMPSLTIQVYAQTLVLLLSLPFFFILTLNVGNCNRGHLLSVSPLILYISLGRSMLMAQIALLGSVSCPVTLMS